MMNFYIMRVSYGQHFPDFVVSLNLTTPLYLPILANGRATVVLRNSRLKGGWPRSEVKGREITTKRE